MSEQPKIPPFGTATWPPAILVPIPGAAPTAGPGGPAQLAKDAPSPPPRDPEERRERTEDEEDRRARRGRRRPQRPEREDILPDLPAAPPTSQPIDRSVPEPERVGNRRRWTLISLVLCVVLPAIASAIYYAFIAAPQYAVEVRFAVRSGSAKSPTDLAAGALTGLAGLAGVSSSSVTESFMVIEFVKSRDLIDQMRPFVDIRKVYSRSEADWLMRLNPEISIEDLVQYWQRRIDIGFDSISQIITLQVRAFTPEDAKRVAEVVVKLSESLINQISERSLRDAVRYAEDEVRRTEDRLKKMRAAVRLFREERQEIDPVRSAQAQLAQVAQLESEISATRAQIDTLRKHMAESAPNVMFLRDKLSSLERRLADERKRLGIGSGEQSPSRGPTMSGLVGDYEELLVEREFAEKAYVSALASLERARFDAIQQHRYLTTFINPSLPQYALFPRRAMNTFLISIGAFVLWAIGLLIAYAIHDHSL